MRGMMAKEKPMLKSETRFDDLAGSASLNFAGNYSLERFCREVGNLDTDVYKPVALRFFFYKEMVITIYCVERKSESIPGERRKVRKVKIKLPLEKAAQYFRQFDCTLVTGEIDMENILVMEEA